MLHLVSSVLSRSIQQTDTQTMKNMKALLFWAFSVCMMVVVRLGSLIGNQHRSLHVLIVLANKQIWSGADQKTHLNPSCILPGPFYTGSSNTENEPIKH